MSPVNSHLSTVNSQLSPLPKSWSELTWQQLIDCWQVKLRYSGNKDIARAAALLQTLSPLPRNGESRANGANGWRIEPYDDDPLTGEKRYLLSPLYKASLPSRAKRAFIGLPFGHPCPMRGGVSPTPTVGKDLERSGRGWVCTARELAYYAKQAMPWFDFPYGDPGEKEQKDEKGNTIKERREGVRGYVSNMKDAMVLPLEQFKVQESRFKRPLWFQLPQAACANLTWEQYRALQNITPQLFADGNTDEQTVELQAQFLAHILTPRSFALFDTTGGNIKIRPHFVYQYNSERAEKLVEFWKRPLSPLSRKGEGFAPLKWLRRSHPSITGGAGGGSALFHICFQVYQTALSYYDASYPLLFGGGGKQDPLKDALTGEVGTINTIMKYQGYTKPEDVYAENLPIILDVLNTMTKEAKEIEKMNAKIKRK